jgi:hypothetical protein
MPAADLSTRENHVTGTDRAAQLHQQITDGVAALGGDKQWRTLLELSAQMGSRYSLGNTLLIGLQRPDATVVAGYQAWRKAGRRCAAVSAAYSSSPRSYAAAPTTTTTPTSRPAPAGRTPAAARSSAQGRGRLRHQPDRRATDPPPPPPWRDTPPTGCATR